MVEPMVNAIEAAFDLPAEVDTSNGVVL